MIKQARCLAQLIINVDFLEASEQKAFVLFEHDLDLHRIQLLIEGQGRHARSRCCLALHHAGPLLIRGERLVLWRVNSDWLPSLHVLLMLLLLLMLLQLELVF